MTIFDFALRMELDGERYYRELAAKEQLPELQVVLKGLADDEQRHYQIVQSLQNQKYNDLEPPPVTREQPNVFELSRGKEFVLKDKDTIAKLRDEQIDLYQAALQKEQASVQLYKKLHEESPQPAEKAILERLVREEERHADILDNLIELLNRVHDWVESAEFNQQKPY